MPIRRVPIECGATAVAGGGANREGGAGLRPSGGTRGSDDWPPGRDSNP